MRVVLVLVLLAIAVSEGCKCGQERIGRRIINGKEALARRYPWMVSVGGGCGGSLISDRHVLTAAHCLDGGNAHASTLRVVLNAHSEEDRRSLPALPVQSFKIHEGYQHTNDKKMSDDIAIITLKEAVPMTDGMNPVCLSDFKDQDNLFLTGWGYQNANGMKTRGTALFEVDLPEVGSSSCKSQWGEQLDPEKELCAGDERGGCQGDSGGPLSTRRDGYVYQVGIVSFGPTNCNIGGFVKPNVYERTQAHLEWIKK